MSTDISEGRATKYDYSRFTQEDERMYREFLESEPYDPKLAEFYRQEYLRSERERVFARRHMAYESFNERNMTTDDHHLIENLMLEEARQVINEVTNVISNRHKRVLVWYYVAQMTQKNIARQMGITRDGVAWILRSSLQKMRQHISEHKIENPL